MHHQQVREATRDFPLGDVQDGDVLLSRRGDAGSALLALYSAVPGPFSHAAVCGRNASGNRVVVTVDPGGLQTLALPEYLAHFVTVAVVRHERADPVKLGAIVRAELARCEEQPVEFQMDLRRNGETENRFNCLGFVDNVYAKAALPPPFPRSAPVPTDLWFEQASRHLSMDVRTSPSANSVLHQAGFRRVVTWENKTADGRRRVVAEAVAEVVHEAVLAGWTPRREPLGTRLWLRPLQTCGLVGEQARDLLALRMAILDYDAAVQEPLLRYFDRQGGVADATTVRQMALECARLLRSRFLQPPAQPRLPEPAAIETRARRFLQLLEERFADVLPPAAGMRPLPRFVVGPDVVGGDGRPAAGYTDYVNQELRINPPLAGERLDAVLAHESAHWLLYAAAAYPRPNPGPAGGSVRLPTIPPWLMEGFAACGEAAALAPPGTVDATFQAERARQLVQLLRAGQGPTVGQLLGRDPRQPLTSADYAVAWGVVHVLLSNPEGRAQLGRYLAACATGFDAGPTLLPSLPAANGAAAFNAVAVAVQSHAAAKVEPLLFGGMPVKDWEPRWRRTMLQLPVPP